MGRKKKLLTTTTTIIIIIIDINNKMEIMLLIFLSGYFSQLIGSVILIKYIREKKTVEHLSVET